MSQESAPAEEGRSSVPGYTGTPPASLEKLADWLERQLTLFMEFPRNNPNYLQTVEHIESPGVKYVRRVPRPSLVGGRLVLAHIAVRNGFRWLSHHGITGLPPMEPETQDVLDAERQLRNLAGFVRLSLAGSYNIAVRDQTEKPEWDDDTGTLRFKGQEKRYKQPAPNVRLVLASFQEEGWPEHIHDPLDKGKLADTLRSLNLGTKGLSLAFSLNGKGDGIIWIDTSKKLP